MINDLFSNILKNYKDGKLPRIDFHIHTNWTDGKNSVIEMYEKAVQKKIDQILFSEHVRKTSSSWYSNFAKEIKKLPNKDCKAFIGCETKINDDQGNLDIDQKIIDDAEIIMAVVHRFPGEKGQIMKDKKNIQEKVAIQKEFELTLAAIENSNFHILGHPMGMSLRRFGLEIKDKMFEEIIVKLKKKDLVFEINSRYHNNPKKLLDLCLKHDCMFSLGSNAHSTNELGQIIKLL